MGQTAKELGDIGFDEPLSSWALRDLCLLVNDNASLQAVRAAASTAARFERNVAALLKVQPTLIWVAFLSKLIRLG